jgi:hypothetical protein
MMLLSGLGFLVWSTTVTAVSVRLLRRSRRLWLWVILNLSPDPANASVRLGSDVLTGLIDRLGPLARRWITRRSRTRPGTVHMIPLVGSFSRCMTVSAWFQRRVSGRCHSGRLWRYAVRDEGNERG